MVWSGCWFIKQHLGTISKMLAHSAYSSYCNLFHLLKGQHQSSNPILTGPRPLAKMALAFTVEDHWGKWAPLCTGGLELQLHFTLFLGATFPYHTSHYSLLESQIPVQEFPLPSTCQGCSNNFYYNITLPPTSLRGGYNTVQTKFSPNPYQYRAGYLQQAPSNNVASWASPSSQINLCHTTEEGTKAQSFTWRTSYPWELFLLLSIIWAVFGFWHLLGMGRKGRGQPHGNRYYRTIREGV